MKNVGKMILMFCVSILGGMIIWNGIWYTLFKIYTQIRISGWSSEEAGSIGIIGGADGPTAIFVTSKIPYLMDIHVIIGMGIGIIGMIYYLHRKRKKTN